MFGRNSKVVVVHKVFNIKKPVIRKVFSLVK